MDEMIAIVIVDYHSERLLRRCLDSLEILGSPPLLHIVVDNGGSLDRFDLQKAYPQLTVLLPGRNLGFAGGCNLGLRHALAAGASYVLLLNPDTYADRDFLTPLVEIMRQHPQIGAASPTIASDDGCKIEFAGGTVSWITGRVGCITDDRYATGAPYAPVSFLTGCAMLLRAEAVRDVGYMDESYFLYFEDADYTLALQKKGWTTAYVPATRVRHVASGVVGYMSEAYTYYFARNRIRFMQRWASPAAYVAFMLFNTLIRLPGTILLLTLVRRRPDLASVFLRGFRDGFIEAWRNVREHPAPMVRSRADGTRP